MKNKNIVLLALAIGCGLVAAFLTAKLSAGGKPEMTMVLVAGKPIDQGTKLDEPEKLFVLKPYPKESVPPNFIADVATLKGKTLQRTIRAGSHVTEEDVTPKQAINLPVRADGAMYKAMAIKVAPETVVGGLVLPGARVDVISSEHFQNGKVVAQTVLQNVLVVAVNQTTQTADTQNSFKDAATVTLAVTLREGKILYLAQEKGKISLMLRSKDDTGLVKGDKPVDGLENRRDDESGAGADATQLTVRVPVPTKDIVPGTKIENPAELFVEKEMPDVAVPKNAILTLEELRGKTFTKDAYADMPIVKSAFEGALPKADALVVKPAAAVKTHTMVIQVGTTAPLYVHYDEKGRLLEDATKLGGVPAGTSTGDAPPAKPEDGDKEAKDREKKPSRDEDK